MKTSSLFLSLRFHIEVKSYKNDLKLRTKNSEYFHQILLIVVFAQFCPANPSELFQGKLVIFYYRNCTIFLTIHKLLHLTMR